MKNVHILRADDKNFLAKQAGKKLEKILGQIQQIQKRVLILCSGGSALNILGYINPYVLSSKITITVLDERFTNDPGGRNFFLLKQTSFFKKAVSKGADFISTEPKKGETLNELATRFDNALRLWHKKYYDGYIIATQGMGKDGHTAGIFPQKANAKSFLKQFDSFDSWVVGYYAKNATQYPNRITTTLAFMRRQIDASIVYIAGEEKKEAWRKVLASRGSLNETPARIIREMKSVFVFTNLSSAS